MLSIRSCPAAQGEGAAECISFKYLFLLRLCFLCHWSSSASSLTVLELCAVLSSVNLEDKEQILGSSSHLQQPNNYEDEMQ